MMIINKSLMAIEIQAAVNLWNVRVVVEMRRGAHPSPPLEFVPLRSTPTRTVQIYWTGDHYEPVPPLLSQCDFLF